MATTTHFRELRGRVGVETQGTGDAITGGGWTNLLDIGQDFISGRDYSIVVMGTMGWLDCRNTTLPSAAPFAEVAYQIGGTAGLKRSRAQMVFPTLATPRIGGQNINRAQPFMFIIRVNNYVPATPVRVVARIDPNGVIPYAQQFRFDVQCQSIAFDADELDTTALRFADYFQPLTEIPNSSDGSSNVTPIATRLALPTHPLGLPEKWLIFSEANIVTSDPGHVVEFTSRVLNQPIGDPIDTWRLRSSARAPARGASLTQDNRSRTAMGLCRVVSLEGGTSNEVEQYFHQRAPSNIDKSWWFGGGILAVRLSALQVAGHSTVARTRTNFFADDEPANGAFVAHTPPTIEPPTGPGPKPIYDQRPYVLLASSTLYPYGAGAGSRTGHHAIRRGSGEWVTDTQGDSLSSHVKNGASTFGVGEALGLNRAGVFTPGQQREEFRFHGFHNIVDPLGERTDVDNLLVVGWQVSDGLPPVDPGGGAGNKVAIRFTPDGPSLGILPTPPISPARPQPLSDFGVDFEDFVSELHYRRRFPVTMTVRRGMRFTWSLLSDAALATMLDWINGLERMAFKAEDDLGDVRAFLVLADSVTHEVQAHGPRHRLSFDALESTWLG